MISVCDTGPIVAYLNRNDPHHDWAVALMKQVRPPLLTCEAVLTEVIYFLRDDRLSVDPLFDLLATDALRIEFDMSAHWRRMRTLMRRYDRMDLADACVVVMSETHESTQVLTIDVKDFKIYRRNDRQVIRYVAPHQSN